MYERCPKCNHYVVDHTSSGCYWECDCALTGEEVKQLIKKLALDKKM